MADKEEEVAINDSQFLEDTQHPEDTQPLTDAQRLEDMQKGQPLEVAQRPEDMPDSLAADKGSSSASPLPFDVEDGLATVNVGTFLDGLMSHVRSLGESAQALGDILHKSRNTDMPEVLRDLEEVMLDTTMTLSQADGLAKKPPRGPSTVEASAAFRKMLSHYAAAAARAAKFVRAYKLIFKEPKDNPENPGRKKQRTT